MSLTVQTAGGDTLKISNGQEEYYYAAETIEKNSFIQLSDYAPYMSSYLLYDTPIDIIELRDDLVLHLNSEYGSTGYYSVYARLVHITDNSFPMNEYISSLYHQKTSRSLRFACRVSDDIVVVSSYNTHWTLKIDFENLTITVLESDVSNGLDAMYPDAYAPVGDNMILLVHAPSSGYGIKLTLLKVTLTGDTVSFSELDSVIAVGGTLSISKKKVAVSGNSIFLIDGGTGSNNIYGMHYEITEDCKLQKVGERTAISSVLYCSLYDLSVSKTRDNCFIAHGYSAGYKVRLTDAGFDVKTNSPLLYSLATSSYRHVLLSPFDADNDIFIKVDSDAKMYINLGKITYDDTFLDRIFQIGTFEGLVEPHYISITNDRILLLGIVRESSTSRRMQSICINYLSNKIMRKVDGTIDGILLENSSPSGILQGKKYKACTLKDEG